MVSSLNIKSDVVKKIMLSVPRHFFIDEAMFRHAYDNITLPIGYSQTISQPGVVAIMTEALIEKGCYYGSVLEIGTGCGYQSAILAQLFDVVYSIERIYSLHAKAKTRLSELGIKNVHCYYSDGYNLQKDQKFDAIIITAAPKTIPNHIINRLLPGGRLVSPEGKQGDAWQKLVKIIFDGNDFDKKILANVRFVPLLDGMA